MTERGESRVVAKEACPECGSRDNLARYDDGHAYCFGMGCGYYEQGSGESRSSPRRNTLSSDMLSGEPRDLAKRGINRATCEKFGYWVGQDSAGNTVQIANYRPNGQTVAQKIRTSKKDFFITGDGKSMGLWGRHLWKEGGRRVVVTEGEIDALSYAQVTGMTWPVVSLPKGAAGAEAAIRADLEFLESFEQVVLMFDADDAGRKAAAACAPLFSPGKCALAELPLKDANEMLLAGRVKDLTTAAWQAKVYRPDGIINGADLWDAMEATTSAGLAYPPCLAGLNKVLLGQHYGRLVTWTSGSGMGKSTAVAECAYDLLMRHEQKIAYVALEENCGQSVKRFVGLHLNKPIHLPSAVSTAEERRAAFEATMGSGRAWFYDHFGSMGEDTLLSKLRFLIKSCGSRIVVLDHLSIIVSGSDDNDERRLIDRTMTSLRSLVEETGVLMHLVSHLRRAEGRSHEEGGRVSLSQLRGSHSIAQLSDTVIGLERDQQAEGEEADVATIRVLKDRLTGNTGVAGKVRYNKENGRMEAVEDGFSEYGSKGGDVDTPF